MTGFKTRQGRPRTRPKPGEGPKSLLDQGKRALQRYLLLGTGIASTALGLALIVSFVAATYGTAASGEPDVEVSQIEGRIRSALLDPALERVAPESEPASTPFSAAAPAPPLDVERETASASPQAGNQVITFAPPVPEGTTPSPPAAVIDAEETPELDEVAAALPLPVLAQTAAADEPEEATRLEAPGGLPAIGVIDGVNVTFYDCLVQGFCGAMYNGEPVYEGAAACSWNLPLGTEFVIENDPTQRIYVCADRGLLDNTWVDIFFYNPEDGWAWQHSVGRYGTIYILSVPAVTSNQ